MFIAQWKKATFFRSWLKPWPEPTSAGSSLPVDAKLPFTVEEWDELQRSQKYNGLDPEQTLLQKEKLDRLRKAISRLTLVERECLNLRTKGFRYREIGEILKIVYEQQLDNHVTTLEQAIESARRIMGL